MVKGILMQKAFLMSLGISIPQAPELKGNLLEVTEDACPERETEPFSIDHYFQDLDLVSPFTELSPPSLTVIELGIIQSASEDQTQRLNEKFVQHHMEKTCGFQ